MTAKFLREHAAHLEKFAKRAAERSAADPSNFFLAIAAKSQRDGAIETTRAAALEEIEAAGELVDLRLIGPRADGSVPLDAFVSVVQPFSHALKLAAHRLRHGREAMRRVGEDISSALNLKLAGLAYGSTRILVTGNAQPDLTGESLLQATLTQIFGLLNSKNDEFFEAVDAVGGRAASELGAFVKAIDTAGFAAQFRWLSPRGQAIWDGRPDEITRVRALLATVSEPTKSIETLVGKVACITDTGRLELRTENGKTTVRFPLKLTDQVRRLSITEIARLEVETSVYWDAVQRREIYKRLLVSVA